MAVSLNDSMKVTPVVQIVQGSDLPLNIARAVSAIGRISSSLICCSTTLPILWPLCHLAWKTNLYRMRRLGGELAEGYYNLA